jgi:hypothetical protein
MSINAMFFRKLQALDSIPMDGEVGLWFDENGIMHLDECMVPNGEQRKACLDMLARQYAVYSISIATQGDTGTPSVLEIEQTDLFGNPIGDGSDILRVGVFNSGTRDAASNATIAVTSGSTLVQSVTATKDIVIGASNSGVATLSTVQGSHKDITLTAVASGASGNDITYKYQVGAPSGAIACAVTGTDIVVTGKMTAGTAQVESATVVAPSGCTTDGTLAVTVTGTAMGTSSPQTVYVALTTAANTATLVATAIKAALTANTAVYAAYTIGGSNADVQLTAKTVAANDASLAITWGAGAVAGVNEAGASGVYQIETGTVVCTGGTAEVGAIVVATATNTGPTENGTLNVVFVSALTGTVNVPVALLDTDADDAAVAAKIRTGLNVAPISTHWTIGGTGADITFTAKVAAANDTSLACTWGAYVAGVNACSSITISPTGAAPAASASTNINVTVTSAAIATSPVEIAVALTSGDTASQVATKIRNAMTTAVTDIFTVGGSNADVTLTSKTYLANDATLNVAWDNAVAGVSALVSSTNSTAGARAQNVTAGVASALDSTASEIIAKINATASAVALVTSALASGQNGTGKPTAVAETPLAGGGTGSGSKFYIALTDASVESVDVALAPPGFGEFRQGGDFSATQTVTHAAPA